MKHIAAPIENFVRHYHTSNLQLTPKGDTPRLQRCFFDLCLSGHTMALSAATASFCTYPLLSKRPRPHQPLLTSVQPTHRTPISPRCQLNTPDDAIASKVETTLLASEQQPLDAPPLPIPTVSTTLPVALDLLNFHARTSSRRHATRDIAIRLYRRCLDLNDADGRAWLGLARLQSQRGDLISARSTFRKAIKACPRNAHLLQAWGVFEERQHNFPRAKGLYLAALRADPAHAPTWVALGLWHQRHAHDPSAARLAFRHGAEADPSNYYVWHVWGVLEKSCRRYPRARECFRKGVAANPYNAATYVLWGSLEDELGNSEIAMALFDKAHSVSPRNLHAYLSHAVAADKVGDMRKARRLLTKAISIRPRDPAPRQALALLNFRHGDVPAARETFAKALEKDAKHSPTWHAWARVEWASGDYKRARGLFQEAVWASPRSAHVVRTWHSWATMEMGLGHNDVARRYFSHGLDVNDRSIVLLTGIALLEAKEGNIARSRDYMERCIRVEPWRQSVWRLYQQLETEYGSSRRAQLVYERSVVIGQQVEERFNLADPLPGDFQGSGMWIDALELPADRSAFDSVGAQQSMEVNTDGVRSEKGEVAGTNRNASGAKKRPSRKGSARGSTKKVDSNSPDDERNRSSMRTAFGY